MPTAENTENAVIDESRQQIKELSERLEAENEELKTKLELFEAEQNDMTELLQELRQSRNYVLNTSDTQEFQEIHDITFTFPRQDNTGDWVKYMLPFPKLEEFTMCFWISPEDIQYSFIFSYAKSSSDDSHLAVHILDENALRVFVRNNYYDFKGFYFNAGEKVHLCINLSLYSDTLAVFENGAFKEKKDINSYDYIYDGGALYFGQDQDTPNSGFRYSYKGEISNFIIWPRTLSAMEIRGVATSCSHPKDYILRPQLTNIQWSGNVKVSLDDECHTTVFGSYTN